MTGSAAPGRQLSLFDEPPPSSAATAAAPDAAAAGDPAPAPPGSGAVLPTRLPPVTAPPGGARAARHITLDGHRVAYALRRGRRRSIGFSVGPEGLAVSAPRWVAQADIESALQDKRGWILRKLQEQQERARRLESARIEWRDGAEIPFLGETVILVLDPRATGAVLHGEADALPGVPRRTLHIGLPQGAAAAQVRDAVQSWLQRQARRIFEERCALFAERLGVRVRRLSLSSAATRWGSASADGAIRLNWRLVHFGVPVIDYVVAHELAHLREMNHSAAFWDVVRSVLPGFETARGALRDRVLPSFD